jgi:hypothetical protein
MVPGQQLAVLYPLLKLFDKGAITMRLHFNKFTLIMLTSLLVPFAASAMDAKQQQEFDRIAGLKMADLTRESAALLGKKYPAEDWDKWRFPDYVFTNESVEVGYKIAVKEPELLGNSDITVKEQGIPCYCFCDSMGHKSLLHCFWKKGTVGGKFDDHASSCNICYGQAMLAFLWKNLGASDQEILKGMEKRFAHLPKPN